MPACRAGEARRWEKRERQRLKITLTYALSPAQTVAQKLSVIYLPEAILFTGAVTCVNSNFLATHMVT